jgi:hypothetical protein
MKNSYNDFYQNPSKANTRSHTNGRTLRAYKALYFTSETAPKILKVHLTYRVIKGGTKKQRVALDTYFLRQTLNRKGPSEDTEESDSLSVEEDYG